MSSQNGRYVRGAGEELSAILLQRLRRTEVAVEKEVMKKTPSKVNEVTYERKPLNKSKSPRNPAMAMPSTMPVSAPEKFSRNSPRDHLQLRRNSPRDQMHLQLEHWLMSDSEQNGDSNTSSLSACPAREPTNSCWEPLPRLLGASRREDALQPKEWKPAVSTGGTILGYGIAHARVCTVEDILDGFSGWLERSQDLKSYVAWLAPRRHKDTRARYVL